MRMDNRQVPGPERNGVAVQAMRTSAAEAGSAMKVHLLLLQDPAAGNMPFQAAFSLPPPYAGIFLI